MITVDTPEAYGYTIFCDDIRQEVGGKISFIGAYTGTLFVSAPQFPVILPKLTLGIVYMQRRPNVVLPVTLWVFLPGDADDKPSIVATLPEDISQQMVEKSFELLDKFRVESTYATAHVQFGLLNLVIPTPGILKVRVVRGEQLIRLGALVIDAAPSEPNAPQPPLATPPPA